MRKKTHKSNRIRNEQSKNMRNLFPFSCCHYEFHRRWSPLLPIVNSEYFFGGLAAAHKIMLCGLQLRYASICVACEIAADGNGYELNRLSDA